jgi:hypothetical protein
MEYKLTTYSYTQREIVWCDEDNSDPFQFVWWCATGIVAV